MFAPNSQNIKKDFYLDVYTILNRIYVGETKGELRKRMNGHRSQIINGGNQLLYRHFNLPDHSVLSMREFSRRYIIPQTNLLTQVPPFVGNGRSTGFDNWELLLHMFLAKQRTLTPPDTWSCPIWDLHLFSC